MNYKDLIETLRAISPNKQALVLDAWPGIEGVTPEGQKVLARSGKELRRFTSEKDPAVVDWIRSFEPGEVFYDIGANCGGITLTAAAIHPKDLQIVAIEPSFGSFESLARNLSLNGLLANTIPLQVALLDRTGLEPMNYRSTAAGTSLHAVGAAVDHEGQQFTPVEIQLVPTYTLDDLIAVLALPAPTRIKIDVDGYEEPVLRGAVRTLSAATVRDMTVEIVDHDRQGTRLGVVTELLAGCGYERVEAFHHGAEGGYVADHLFRLRDRSRSPQG